MFWEKIFLIVFLLVGKKIPTVEGHLFFSLYIKIKMLSVSYEVPARWRKKTCHCLTFWIDVYLMCFQKYPDYSDCQFRFIARWGNLDPVFLSEIWRAVISDPSLMLALTEHWHEAVEMISADLCTNAESWSSESNAKASSFVTTAVDVSQIFVLKELDEIIIVSRNKAVHVGHEKNVEFIILKA